MWAALALALVAGLAAATEHQPEELVWSSRLRSRPRLTQSDLRAADTEEQVYGTGYVPGHVGGQAQQEIPEAQSSFEGQEAGGLDAARDATDVRQKDVRKQFIGGPAGLGGPGGGPAAFGGLASHGGCGGVPCGPAPLPPPPPPPVVAAVGAYASCPGGKSLEVECDAKRPWPQCPPQSYCYATNTADVGPYVCCPIWSTYGSKWRPRSAFYPYYPPMPYNWPPAIQATAGWPRQVAPAVAVPVPIPCAVPPCGGPGFGPYKKKKKTVLRKILKGKKRVLHKTARKHRAKAQAQN